MILAIAVLALMQNQWPPNSLDRPKPPVVAPAPEQPPVPPPADAIVLFDGKSLADSQSAAPAAPTRRRGLAGASSARREQRPRDQLIGARRRPGPAQGPSRARCPLLEH